MVASPLRLLLTHHCALISAPHLQTDSPCLKITRRSAQARSSSIRSTRRLSYPPIRCNSAGNLERENSVLSTRVFIPRVRLSYCPQLLPHRRYSCCFLRVRIFSSFSGGKKKSTQKVVAIKTFKSVDNHNVRSPCCCLSPSLTH